MEKGEALPKRAINLMFLLTAGFWFTQYAITPYINAELERLGAGASVMGLVGGAYGLTQLLVRIPLGMTADWYGRQKPFIIAGCFLSALASVGFLVWYTPTSYIIWRGLAGLASASWVSFTVLFGSYFPPDEVPKRISQLNIYNQLGRLFSYVIIGAAVARFALGSAFWITAAFGCAVLALSFFIKEKPVGRQGLKLSDFRLVARDRNLKVCSLLGILTQVVAFSTFYGFSTNLAMRLGAEGPQLSMLSITLVVPSVIFNYLGSGLLYKRFRPRVLVAAGFLAAMLYSLIAPQSQTMMQLYLCQILAGIASAFTFGILLGQSVRDVPQKLRSAAMGLFQSLYGIGMTIGPILMGVLIDLGSLNGAFYSVAGLSLISALLALRLMRPPEPIL